MATDTSSRLTSKKREDRIGERHGRLLVTGVGRTPQHVLVTCDCGTQKSVHTSSLLRGGAKSCGCLKKELLGKKNRTHGMSDSPEFKSWYHAIERCVNPNASGYANYGGRGIAVCERWQESFQNFYEDMGPRPDGTSLDRIDNSRGYEPGNCRWATRKQQNENTRRNRVFSWFGTLRPLSVICDEVGANYFAVHSRISKLGWGFERAVFTPTGACR